jgi:hypothetical protein
LAAPQTVQLGGTAYSWQAWSDGGGAVHTIVAKGQSQYTASYTTPKVEIPPQPEPPKPPGTFLRKHPPKSTRSTTAAFAFATTTGAGFRCKLDAKPMLPCRSPKVYRHLKPGSHVFQAAAINSAGTADPTPAKFRWKILPPR